MNASRKTALLLPKSPNNAGDPAPDALQSLPARILFINQFYWPDTAATGQLLTDVTRALGNCNCAVLCGQPDYGAVDETASPPVEILRVGPSRFNRGKLRRLLSYASFLSGAVVRTMIVKRPHVVVTLTTPPLASLLGTLLKMLRGTRHFIWEMDVYPDIATDLGVIRLGSLQERLIRLLANWSRRRADGIIVLGSDMKSRLLRHGVPDSKIHIAENWADGSQILPLAFPSGPLVIHYSGNLGLAHDIDTVIGALKHLGNDQRVRFVFAGGGARRQALEDFCIEAQILNVEFRPYATRADLGVSLGSGHLGLVTQLPESCGSVVPSKTYGIMAAGRPVLYIGPADGTPARIIETHRCGWRIEPGDVEGLIGLVLGLADNRSPIVEAGMRARKAFEREYDLKIGVSRVISILGFRPMRLQKMRSVQF
jgi:glycosyltransferase involved in cell wall biosynthesis